MSKEITKEDFQQAIDVLKKLRPSVEVKEPARFSIESWSTLFGLVIGALEFAAKILFDKDGNYEKPGWWKKLRMGGFFIGFIVSIVKLFSKG